MITSDYLFEQCINELTILHQDTASDISVEFRAALTSTARATYASKTDFATRMQPQLERIAAIITKILTARLRVEEYTDNAHHVSDKGHEEEYWKIVQELRILIDRQLNRNKEANQEFPLKNLIVV